MKTLLYAENVSRSFDGFKALDIERFILQENELRVVIGPNGAGKTTFLDVICGRTKPDTGRIVLGETEIQGFTETQIYEAGIGRKFQAPTVFGSLTVQENLMLAAKAPKGVFATLLHRESLSERSRLLEVAEKTGLVGHLSWIAGALSHGQKQWLEIAMVIVQEPRVLLVDEPAAGMTDEETWKTGELLQELSHDHAIVVIEHDMAFVRQIARTVTVLHEGRVLVEGPMDKVQADPRVIECYLGKGKA
jgi:urea transport system ATP-binding protein